MNLSRGGQVLNTATRSGRHEAALTRTALDSASHPLSDCGGSIRTGMLFALFPDLLERLTVRMPVALRQVASYLVVGTIAAPLNLAVLHLIYDVALLPISLQGRYLIDQAVATELATIVCFIGNDTFTYKHLAGQARP